MNTNNEVIVLSDNNSNLLEYVEVTNTGQGVIDAAKDMVVLTDYNSNVPVIRPLYVAENVANKKNDLSNPNTTGYTSTLAVHNALTGFSTSWLTLKNRPAWLTGTTLFSFESGHTHNQYLLNMTFNNYSGTTIPANYYNKTQINSIITGITTNSYTKSEINYYTGSTLPNNYYNKIQINNYTGNTSFIINNKLNTTIFNTFTGTTLPANYYNKIQINDYTGSTNILINNKINKVTDATNNNIATFISSNIQDSGKQFTTTIQTVGLATNSLVPTELAVRNAINQAIASVITLQGDWNANTNTPNLQVTGITTGFAWRISVSGHTNLGGITTWLVGDLAIKSANGWIKLLNEDIAAVWGNISGTLSNQTDLQLALNDKLNTLIYQNFTGTTLPNNYYNKTQINNYTGKTNQHFNTIDMGLSWLSGNTTFNFIGSGTTIVNTSGTNPKTIHIFSPSGATGQKGDQGLTGPSGLTPTFTFTGSGSTIVHQNKIGNSYTLNIYAPSGHTGAKGDQGLTGPSGLTKTNYYTFIESGATVIKTGSTNTVTIYTPTSPVSSWTTLTNKPQWLSGTTLSAFQTGHTHSQYVTTSQINYYTGTTVPNNYYNKTQINGYTGTTVPNTYKTKLDFNTFTGTTLPANYYNKTQINGYTGTTVPNNYYNKTQINYYTGTTVPNNYYNKTQINNYTGSTNIVITNAITGATSGITLSSRVVKNNLITGIVGGQTIIGSKSTNSGLNIKATSASGTTGADIAFQVGNNGATEAMRILNNANVGIGNTAPTVSLELGNSTLGGNQNINSNNGAEMFTSFLRTNWILTSGWDITNGNDTKLFHNAAGVTTATLNTVAAVVGTLYKIVIANTYSGGTIAYSFGGVAGTSLAATQTYTNYLVANTTAGLIFTPVTAARGSITSISIIPQNQNGNLTIGGKITINRTNLVTNNSNGIELFNNTLATSGVTSQYSPSIVLKGAGWNNTTSVPQYVKLAVVPRVSSSILEAGWAIAGSIDGTSWTNVLNYSGAVLTSNANFNAQNVTSETSNLAVPASGVFIGNGAAATSTAGNKIRVSNQFQLYAHRWNGSVDQIDKYRNYIRPIADGLISENIFQYSPDGGTTYKDAFSILGTYSGTTPTINIYNKLGIGFAVGVSPTYPLEVNNGIIATSSNNSVAFRATNTSLTYLAIANGASSTSYSMYVKNGSDGLYRNLNLDGLSLILNATSYGNVGIATVTPTNTLSFGGNVARTIWMERNNNPLSGNTSGNTLTIQSGGATSGSANKKAGMLQLNPGVSTGTGFTSVRIGRTTRASVSGTTDNTITDAIIVSSEKNLTNTTVKGLFTVALPTLTMAGGYIVYSITSTDGTNMQVHSGVINYAAVNKGGVYTTSIVDGDAEAVDATAASSGNLTDAWTITTGTNLITINVVATSTVITPTIMKIYYTLHNNSKQAISQL